MRTPVHKVAMLMALVALLSGAPAFADCVLNGEAVAEGTRAGGLVCQGGQWVGG